MIVKVLGSAAGGGFPQWNCNSRLSRMAWDGVTSVTPRTQSSISASISGFDWLVINASPDIRQQIAANPELQPQAGRALRDSPIKEIILTNADVDHIAGLLSLRERQPFRLYATPRVLATLEQNNIFDVLVRDVVERIPLQFEMPLECSASGVSVVPFQVPGKVALYREDASQKDFGTEAGDTIGVKLAAQGSGTLFYIPGCGSIDGAVLSRVHGADCLLFDGTLFTDTEMLDLKVGQKSGRRMGHAPISGKDGSLHAFDKAGIRRKVYIHINTTNPILEEGSEAEQAVRAAGWEIAYDGMTLNF